MPITQTIPETSKWVEISENDPLIVGDRVKTVFQLTPGSIYVQAVLVGDIERNIENDPNLRLIRSTYPYNDDPNVVAYEIEIVRPGDPSLQYAGWFTVLVMVAIIVGELAFGYIYGTANLKQVFKYYREGVLAGTPEGLEILQTEAQTEAVKVQESNVTKMTISGVAVAVILAILYKSGILGK